MTLAHVQERSMRRGHIKLVLLIAAGVMPLLGHTAIPQVIDEGKAAKVKAAYIYNFGKFVTWPDAAFENEAAPVVIGVIGPESFVDILDDTVWGKTVRGRKLLVKRVKFEKGKIVDGVRSCHILYISSSERDRAEAILRALDKASVLTVGDEESFASNGGMIGLALREGRIVFYVNHQVVKDAELKLSARLLKLARLVRSHKRPKVST